MSSKEKGLIGAHLEKSDTDSLVIEIGTEEHELIMRLSLASEHMASALLAGREFPVHTRQTSFLEPTDKSVSTQGKRVKGWFTNDSMIISRTNNNTITLEVMRDQGAVVFCCELALDAFSLLLTGKSVDASFCITRHCMR